MEVQPYHFRLDTEGDDLVMTIDWRRTSHGMDGAQFDLLHEDVLTRLVRTLQEQPTVSSIVIQDIRLYHLVGALMSFLRMMLDLDSLLERCAGNDPLSPHIPEAANPQVRCNRCPLNPALVFTSLRENLSEQFSTATQTAPGTPLKISETLNGLSHHMDTSPFCQRCRGRTHEELINIYNEMVEIETFSRKEALFIISDSRKIRI